MRTLRSKTAVRQLKKDYAAEHPRQRQICFLLQDWTDPYNVGAMFRVADALGALELVLTGDTPEPGEEGPKSRDSGPRSEVRGARDGNLSSITPDSSSHPQTSDLGPLDIRSALRPQTSDLGPLDIRSALRPQTSDLGPRKKTKGWQQRVVGKAQIAVTSLGAHRRVPWRKIVAHDEAALKLIEEGWTLVAVEIAEGAVPYTEFEYPERVCLVLGQEQRGVYEKVLKHCSGAVYIPMAGKGRSLNVTHAAAVVGFWVAGER